MLNQLLGSSERERRFKKSRVFKEVLGQQLSLHRLDPPSPTPSPPPTDSDRPAPSRLPPTRLLDYNYEDVSGWNIREGVKQRLRSKRVFLPQIEGDSLGLRKGDSREEALRESVVEE
jgi:hypothetical protein